MGRSGSHGAERNPGAKFFDGGWGGWASTHRILSSPLSNLIKPLCPYPVEVSEQVVPLRGPSEQVAGQVHPER